MHRLITLAALLCAFQAQAAVNVLFDLRIFTNTAIIGRQVVVSPTSVQVSSPTVYALDTYTFTTAATPITVSNMALGNYKVKMGGSPATEFVILVSGTNADVNCSDIIVSGVTTPSGSYSAAVQDGRFLKLSGGTMTGHLQATNVTTSGFTNITGEFRHGGGTAIFEDGIEATHFKGDGGMLTNLNYGELTNVNLLAATQEVTRVAGQTTQEVARVAGQTTQEVARVAGQLTNHVASIDSPAQTILIAAGDSMTSYGGTPGPGNWVNCLLHHTNIVGRVRPLNIAKSGDNLSTQLAYWTNYFQRFMPDQREQCVVLPWIGVNDSYVGHSLITYSNMVSTNLTAYWTAFRTNNCKVAAMTIFNAGSAGEDKSNAINSVNAWIRTLIANTNTVDMVIDPDGYRWDGSTYGTQWGSGTQISADGLHPTYRWSTNMATNIVAVLASNGIPITNISSGLSVLGESDFWPYTAEEGQPSAKFHGDIWMCDSNDLVWFDRDLNRASVGLRPFLPDELSVMTMGLPRLHVDDEGRVGLASVPTYWYHSHKVWQIGEWIKPSASYNYIWELTATNGYGSNQMGNTQPVWNQTLGATTSDGDLIWTCRTKAPSDTLYVWSLGSMTNIQSWYNWLGTKVGEVSSNGIWYLGSNGTQVVVSNGVLFGNGLQTTNATFYPATGGSVAATFNGDISISNLLGAYASVKAYGAVGDGTTDDTAAFQAALNSGYAVIVPPDTDGYVCGNLLLTNNTTLLGYGSVILFKTNTTGYLLDCGTNENITVRGLRLNGLASFNGATATESNRSGIFINTYGTNSFFENLTVYGFAGTGVAVSGYATVSDSYARSPSKIANVECYWCYRGFVFSSAAATELSEYIGVQNLNAHNCKYGAFVSAGNVNITSSMFNRNATGVAFFNGQNSGHGNLVGCQINHNTVASITATNIVTGWNVLGCQMWQGAIHLSGCKGFCIESSTVDVTDIICDENDYNAIRNNRWYGSYANTYTVTAGDKTLIYNNTKMTDGTISDAGGSSFIGTTNVVTRGRFLGNDLTITNTGTLGGLVLASNVTLYPSNYLTPPLRVFGNSGASALIVNSNGFVGIGAANPGTYMLNVGGGIYCNTLTAQGSIPGIYIIDSTASSDDWLMLADTNELLIVNTTDGRNDFVVNGIGNVGIQTVNPLATLHVNGSVILSNDVWAGNLTSSNNVSAGWLGAIYGNGAGLTNTMTRWNTNKAANGATLNIAVPNQHTNAAGAVTFTGLSNLDTSAVNETRLLITCDAEQQITVPVSWTTTDGVATWTLDPTSNAVLRVWTWGDKVTNCEIKIFRPNGG